MTHTDITEYLDYAIHLAATRPANAAIRDGLPEIRCVVSRLPAVIRRFVRGAVVAPLFLTEPPPRTMSLRHSYFDYDEWQRRMGIVPAWPYMPKEMFLMPDFRNTVNAARDASKPFPPNEILATLETIAKECDTNASRTTAEWSANDETTMLLGHVSRSCRSVKAILTLEDLRFLAAHGNFGEFAEMARRLLADEVERTKAAFEFIESPLAGKRPLEACMILTHFVLEEKLALLTWQLNGLPVTATASAAKDNLRERTDISAAEFAAHALSLLPLEPAYHFREALLNEPKTYRRDPEAKLRNTEMAIANSGWTIAIASQGSALLNNTVDSFITYAENAFGLKIQPVPPRRKLDAGKIIVVGNKNDLPDYAEGLRQRKDYRIVITPEQIVVCGFDDSGAMHGVYNLEARMNLREAPFLPCPLDVTRHSLFKVRMTFSCLGRMDWPDEYLSLLPRYGIDALYASPYANILGGCRYRGFGHIQLRSEMNSLIARAAKFGLKLYCPFINQINGDQIDESELIRRMITAFPEIKGYILLTEGFGGSSEIVGEISRAAHGVNPEIEIIPWNYNGAIIPEENKRKSDFIRSCPEDTIPMITWEKGCKIRFDNESRYVYDYSISVVGPSEVWAKDQIKAAQNKGMKDIYARADSWNNWQFGTLPYLPFPHQWLKRFESLREFGITGTLDCWTYGFWPNFIAELKYWYSWSNAPEPEDLLRQIARREFGENGTELALEAWECFSDAITLVPDTGHGILCNACAAPLFFEEPPRRMWLPESEAWRESFYGGTVNPYWPYAPRWAYLYPDFTNQKNMAALYAKNYLTYFENLDYGEKGLSLKVFLKYLRLAADKMEKGLRLYRRAAVIAPEEKKLNATRQIFLAEQIKRMLLSDAAVLEFEDCRFALCHAEERNLKHRLLDRMTDILQDELIRTLAFLDVIRRDSRMGFEWEADYFYTPEVINEKIKLLKLARDTQIPDYRMQVDGRKQRGCVIWNPA